MLSSSSSSVLLEGASEVASTRAAPTARECESGSIGPSYKAFASEGSSLFKSVTKRSICSEICTTNMNFCETTPRIHYKRPVNVPCQRSRSRVLLSRSHTRHVRASNRDPIECGRAKAGSQRGSGAAWCQVRVFWLKVGTAVRPGAFLDPIMDYVQRRLLCDNG